MVDNGYPAAFDALLNEYLAQRRVSEGQAGPSDEERAIVERIWDAFGSVKTIMISDMSGFTRIARKRGILHYLSLIHELRPLAETVIVDHEGQVVKWEADNIYTSFDQVDDAIGTAMALHDRLALINRDRHDEYCIRVAFGIDKGRVLLLGDHEYYGDPVNIASKLAEDIGSRDDLLITPRVFEECGMGDKHRRFQWDEATESGVTIEFYRFRG